MKNKLVLAVLFVFTISATAQFKISPRITQATSDGFKAASFSDADAARVAHESVDWMDKHNPVAGPADPYTIRLNKLVSKHQSINGIQLNYKVYKVVDINAFACPDGSVRVFSSLMDIMSDEELLGVIGHEVGHVANHDSRDAIKQAYLRSAVMNGAASQSNTIAKLTDSQLGKMADAILDSKFSRGQESAADDFSYEFLKKNNYNVMALSSAFEKLAKLDGGNQQSKLAKMFSSHPDSQKRAEAVAQKAQRDGLAPKK